MIVTLTLNTCIDRALFVPSFQFNRTLRVTETACGLGGKPLVASWVLGILKSESLVLGLAAGPTGRQIKKMLDQRGIRSDFVWVGGDSRLNTLIICTDGSGQSTLTVESLTAKKAHIDRLWKKYLDVLESASCVVLGGSLPKGVEPEIFAGLIDAAYQKKIPVVFDASGPGLTAGLMSRPTIIKPNRDELEELTGSKIRNVKDAWRCASTIQAKFGTMVVTTLGDWGAITVLQDRTYFIPPLKIDKVVNSAGAGDAILAGLALALSRHEPIENGLRVGFAAAAAVLLTPATGECRLEDVLSFESQVRLVRYPERNLE
jgi:1-phosphofructokinase family hexose kinase